MDIIIALSLLLSPLKVKNPNKMKIEKKRSSYIMKSKEYNTIMVIQKLDYAYD